MAEYMAPDDWQIATKGHANGAALVAGGLAAAFAEAVAKSEAGLAVDDAVNVVAEAITGLTGADRSDIEDRVSAILRGIDANADGVLNLADAQAIVDQTLRQIGEVFDGQVVTPINDAVSQVKDWLGGLLGWQSNTGERVDQAQSQAQEAKSDAAQATAGVDSLSSTVALQGGRPLWDGIDNTGDSSVPFAVVDRSVGVTANTARWAFVRIARPDPKKVLTYLARREGTVDSLNIDFYRIENGAAVELVHSSPNLSQNLATGYSYFQYAFPQVPMQYGEIVGVQVRMTGSGTVGLAGREMFYGANAMYRPFQLGATRNPASDPSPASISQSVMDLMYSNLVPYMQLGSDDSPLTAPRTIADGFDTDLTRWVVQGTNGGPVVSGGKFTYNGWADGQQMGLYGIGLATDKYNVAALLSDAAGTRESYLIGGSDNMGGMFMAAGITASKVTLYSVEVNGSSNSFIYADEAPVGGNGVWTMTHDGTGLWKVFKGASTKLGTEVISWRDELNWHPIGDGYRFFGLGLRRSFFANSGKWDNFVAKDVENNYSEN